MTPHNITLHITPVGRYLWVLAALLTLLALSAGSALLKLGSFNTVINLGISVMKTLLVMTVFMHETEARNLTRMTSALGFVWLAMLIGLALFDFMTRAPVPAPWQ
ncbi:MAG: cytochrome C oxidase subunit IV family protein [Steroidobacteraceae bacterium]